MNEIELAELIKKCSGVIYLCGNGGSAASASHFANDLIKLGYRVMSLVESVPVITMIANDYGFDFVFSKQMTRASSEDILVVLSVSGNSENIVQAVKEAHNRDMMVVGLLGKSGGKSGRIVAHHHNAPSDNYKLAEDEHMFFLHDVIKKLE